MNILITVIDYGVGNLKSVQNALSFIGIKSVVTDSPESLIKADSVILPGVGSFGDAMYALEQRNLDSAIKEYVFTGKPILGICLGLHLFFEESEESPNIRGLSILKGKIKLIPGDGLKVPQIGWNNLKIHMDNGIFKNIDDNSFTYFVHSYYLDSNDDNSIISATAQYGVSIGAAICHENINAVQFHPEKSGRIGLKILDNFSKLS